MSRLYPFDTSVEAAQLGLCLTAHPVVEVRSALLHLGRIHGWVAVGSFAVPPFRRGYMKWGMALMGLSIDVPLKELLVEASKETPRWRVMLTPLPGAAGEPDSHPTPKKGDKVI